MTSREIIAGLIVAGAIWLLVSILPAGVLITWWASNTQALVGR